ncbi:MAG: ABC transporter substrate-binding protein [Lautropia sp.]
MPSDGVYKDRIDWGLMMDLSGTASASQIPWVKGAQSYVRTVNEAGGVNGRKINLLVEDDRYNAAQDRVNYERLVNQTPVLGISGVGNSSAQAALMPTIKAGKVPIVGSYAITKLGLEPATPMYYAGFCGTKEMAQVGVGHFTESMKLKAPKVATVHMDVAGGKEYADYVAAEAKKHGGSGKSLPVKVGAADVTAQVLEIAEMKPDFVTVYGVPTNSLLLMRAMQQYGLKIPTFAITHLGTPEVYAALGPDAGANYHFVSCFTPGDVADSEGVKAMSAAADRYGHASLKTNVNFVGGWVIGQLIVESVKALGNEPSREKLVAMLAKGIDVDTQGVSAPLRYAPGDHRGLTALRPYSYDFTSKTFKAVGKYADFEKFVK